MTRENQWIGSCELIDPDLPELAWYLKVCPNYNNGAQKDRVIISFCLLAKEDLKEQKQVNIFK